MNSEHNKKKKHIFVFKAIQAYALNIEIRFSWKN